MTKINPINKDPMLRSLIALGVGLCLVSPAYSQHLGLKAGDSLSTVRSKTTGLIETNDTGYYKATRLPQNPPGNDGDYRLVIGKKTGLCQIAVFWSIRDDSRYGDNTKDRFEKLENALDKKYGSDGNKYKFVRSGALWDEDNEFMMALLKEDRFHSAYWSQEDGQNLPAETKIISLRAIGTSSSSALIKLTYQFNNYDECEKELNDEDTSML